LLENEYVLIIFLNTCLKFLLHYINYNKVLQTIELEYNEYLLNSCIKYNKIELYEQNVFNIKKIQKYIINI
jgi:hypothetical protein